jgi:hypothetical protein
LIILLDVGDVVGVHEEIIARFDPVEWVVDKRKRVAITVGVSEGPNSRGRTHIDAGGIHPSDL